MRSAMIGGAHLIAVPVRQGPLDCIGLPLSRLVQQGAGHCTKAMRRHFIRAETHPAQCRSSGILGHWPVALAHGRKYQPSTARQRAQLAKNRERLPRQWDDVLAPLLHARGRDAPHIRAKVELAPLGLTKLAGPDEDVRQTVLAPAA